MKSWWQVLGVPRGSDRATIRRAYAAKLKTTNPEDDPKGFMALREAYEAALRWVDYDYGWDDEEHDAEDADAPAVSEASLAAVPDPVPSEPLPVEAVAEPAFAPLPPEAPPSPQSDDPVEQARLADAADLQRRQAALEAGLRGPWFKDKPGLIAAFEALMAAPALMEIDRRDRVEYWLAALIADTSPRSDAILKQAMAAFGWEEEGNHPPAVWQIRARLDEWRIIARFERGEHPLASGWRVLTPGDVPGWRRRIGALRPGVAAQVRALFEIAEYELPGLVHSFHPDAADWWRRHLEGPRFGFAEIALLLLGALGAALFALVGDTPALRTGGALGAGAAGIALALVHWRVVAPMRWRREQEGAGLVPGFGWRFGLWLIAAAMFIGAPMSAAVASGAILLALASAVAIFLLDAEESNDPFPWKRVIGLGLLAAIGGSAFAAMTLVEQVALLAFAASCGLIGISARARMGHLLGSRPILAALAATVLLIAGAITRSDIGAAGSALLHWSVAAGSGLLLMSALRTRDPDGRDGAVASLVGWGLWIALVIVAIGESPPRAPRGNLPPPIAVVPSDPMQTPEFRAIKAGNPELYAEVEAIRAAMADGKRNRDEGAREIDRLINIAYRTRLPFAPAALVAAEMDIRLAQLREFSTRDLRSCSGEDRGKATAPLSRGLQQRHYDHALRVAASTPLTLADMAKGREIPAAELLRSASDGDAATATRFSDAMKGSDLRAKCAARIALIEALVAHEDVDVAKTMRPALVARAAPDSAKK